MCALVWQQQNSWLMHYFKLEVCELIANGPNFSDNRLLKQSLQFFCRWVLRFFVPTIAIENLGWLKLI